MLITHRCVLLLVLAASFLFVTDARATEQKFVAILIWGTDGDKPEEKAKDLKDVDAALKDKFKNIFKWKNYYEVSRTNITVTPSDPRHVKLSDKCEVKINHTENKGTEVELIGEGKSVYKNTISMPLKDILIMGGPDKDATSWFVVLKPE
ncbi:MAG TPA: hypothetical protein VM735_07515 [Candidatus Kapabacteria bacterium]|nr:hypothetical protein [Candidatus Kapabacteria bacterium]